MYTSSHRKCSVKRVFLEILQNSQENTCVRVSFLRKLQAFLIEHLRSLLLDIQGINEIFNHHKPNIDERACGKPPLFNWKSKFQPHDINTGKVNHQKSQQVF